MNKKVLEMPFHTAATKDFTLTVNNPRADLTKAEVALVMADIVAKNIFATTSGDLVAALDPVTQTTDTVALV